MELVGMSELDLNGVLFIHYPDSISLDECRERLELGIAEAHEYQCRGCEDEEEKPKMCISPYWCYMAMHDRHHREIEKLGKEDRKRYLAECWKVREEARMKSLEAKWRTGLTIPSE